LIRRAERLFELIRTCNKAFLLGNGFPCGLTIPRHFLQEIEEGLAAALVLPARHARVAVLSNDVDGSTATGYAEQRPGEDERASNSRRARGRRHSGVLRGNEFEKKPAKYTTCPSAGNQSELGIPPETVCAALRE
jgi:hypothetical protein